MMQPFVESQADEVDQARAREYSLLSALLLKTPDSGFLADLANLHTDSSPLGSAHEAIAQAALRANVDELSREYFNLFVGVGRGELLPYASFYLTGSLHGRPLASLREAMREIGIERAEWLQEPEDHAGVLFEIMSELVSGNIAAPLGTDREIFQNYLASWIGRFFSDLEHARSAEFYARVGALGRLFMQIEAQAFSIQT
jgi:TorA maturation chaperone TorD